MPIDMKGKPLPVTLLSTKFDHKLHDYPLSIYPFLTAQLISRIGTMVANVLLRTIRLRRSVEDGDDHVDFEHNTYEFLDTSNYRYM